MERKWWRSAYDTYAQDTWWLTLDHWDLLFTSDIELLWILDICWRMTPRLILDPQHSAMLMPWTLPKRKPSIIYLKREKDRSIRRVSHMSIGLHDARTSCKWNVVETEMFFNEHPTLSWQCLRIAMHIHISPSVTTYKDGLFSAKHASSARQRNNTFECAEAVGWST